MSGGPFNTKGNTYVEKICAPEGEYTFSIMVSKTDSDSNPVCTCFSLSAAMFLETNYNFVHARTHSGTGFAVIMVREVTS